MMMKELLQDAKDEIKRCHGLEKAAWTALNETTQARDAAKSASRLLGAAMAQHAALSTIAEQLGGAK
jgi:hypothetical protein